MPTNLGNSALGLLWLQNLAGLVQMNAECNRKVAGIKKITNTSDGSRDWNKTLRVVECVLESQSVVEFHQILSSNALSEGTAVAFETVPSSLSSSCSACEGTGT